MTNAVLRKNENNQAKTKIKSKSKFRSMSFKKNETSALLEEVAPYPNPEKEAARKNWLFYHQDLIAMALNTTHMKKESLPSVRFVFCIHGSLIFGEA